ncbi:hypothetical protein [Gemmobacter serpentinus]|uniref:hypothetical protein n=1 Tax=Gemmobacter serpentinus TaxID=2652247 RepID=UPI00124EAE82|nr:hypothetical protein [Gemmobacter serpentinus]
MRNALPMILVGLLVLGGITGLFLLGGGGADRRLDGSTIGVEALAPWLSAQGLPAEQSNPRVHPDIARLSLRLLPLYDTDLDQDATRPADARAAYYATTLRDLDRSDVMDRIYGPTALVVLPKWVNGTVVSAVAHRSGLIPAQALDVLTLQLGLGALKVIRPEDGMLVAPVEGGNLALFLPQLFDATRLPDVCRPTLSLPQGALVVSCHWPDTDLAVHLLSDPDLLNNHGLTLGDNGAILVALLKSLVPPPPSDTGKNRKGSPAEAPAERRIYVDTAGENLVTYYDYSNERQDYDRSSDDFARFFAPPLAGIWAMLLIVLGIALWRGALRFGPLLTTDSATPEQSKTTAIETNARLLRIAGHDARLVSEYVQTSLSDLAQSTFGRGPGSGAQGIARLFTHLERRDPAATRTLRDVVSRLEAPDPNARSQDLRRNLDMFRTVLEKLTHVH